MGNVQQLPKGTIPSQTEKHACRGYILVEPSHTEIAKATPRGNVRARAGASRWGNVKDDNSKSGYLEGASKACGYIFLLEDENNLFSATSLQHQKNNDNSDENMKSDDQQISKAVGMRIPYRNEAIGMNVGAHLADDSSPNPRRGDLVTFLKERNSNGARDVRIISRASATLVRGNMKNIDFGTNTANLISTTDASHENSGSTDKQREYDIDLEDVISCNPKLLKDNEEVEG